MNKLLIILSLSITLIQNAFNQTGYVTNEGWQWLNPVPFGGNLATIHVAGENNIIASGFNGSGFIMYSNNGGNTWDFSDIPQDISFSVTNILLHEDNQTGYAVSGGKILVTNDGGQSWQYALIDSSISDFYLTSTPEYSGLSGISVAGYSQKIGWVSTSTDDKFEYFLLKDRNDKFKIDISLIPDIWVNYQSPIKSMFFTDSLTGWIQYLNTASDWALARTKDGCKTWQHLQTFDRWCEDLYFINDSIGWVKLVFEGSAVWQKTNDGGLTWKNTKYGTFDILNFSNDINNRLWMAATQEIVINWEVVDIMDSVFISDDMGESWEYVFSTTKGNQNRSSVFALNYDTAFFVSDSLYVTYNSGQTWKGLKWASGGKVFFINSRTGFNWGSSGEILHMTLDGGRSWNIVLTDVRIPEIILNSNSTIQCFYDISLAGLRKFNTYSISPVLIKPELIHDISYDGILWDDPLFAGDYYHQYFRETICALFEDEYNSYYVVYKNPEDPFWYQKYSAKSDFSGEFVGMNLPYAWDDSKVLMENGFFERFIKNITLINYLTNDGYYIRDNEIFMIKNSSKLWSNSGNLNHLQNTGGYLYVVGDSIWRKDLTNYTAHFESLGSPGSSLNFVNFLNSSTGFLCADNCEIYKTINSGNFWTKSYKPVSQVNNITNVYFINEYEGYVTSSNCLYKTIDGGFKWNVVTSGNFGDVDRLFVTGDGNYSFLLNFNGVLTKIKNLDGAKNQISLNVKDFCIIGNSTVFCVSDNEISISENLGDQWKNLYYFPDVELNALTFTDALNGYVGGNFGIIMKTTDGGKNWLDISVAGVNVNGLSFPTTDTGFVGADNGTFFITFNGGNTWIPKNINTNDNIHNLRFFNPTTGYIVTSEGFLMTRDGGDFFELQRAPLRDKKFRKTEVRFPVGHYRKTPSLFVFDSTFSAFIYAYDMNILREVGATPSNGYPSALPLNIPGKDHVSIFPNPTFEQLFIKFNDPGILPCTITSYNISGKLVDEVTINQQEEQFSVINYPAGLYLIKISSANYFEIKKLIIQ